MRPACAQVNRWTLADGLSALGYRVSDADVTHLLELLSAVPGLGPDRVVSAASLAASQLPLPSDGSGAHDAPAWREMARAAFDAIDMDGDGRITRDEIEVVLAGRCPESVSCCRPVLSPPPSHQARCDRGRAGGTFPVSVGGLSSATAARVSMLIAETLRCLGRHRSSPMCSLQPVVEQLECIVLDLKTSDMAFEASLVCPLLFGNQLVTLQSLKRDLLCTDQCWLSLSSRLVAFSQVGCNRLQPRVTRPVACCSHGWAARRQNIGGMLCCQTLTFCRC